MGCVTCYDCYDQVLWLENRNFEHVVEVGLTPRLQNFKPVTKFFNLFYSNTTYYIQISVHHSDQQHIIFTVYQTTYLS